MRLISRRRNRFSVVPHTAGGQTWKHGWTLHFVLIGAAIALLVTSRLGVGAIDGLRRTTGDLAVDLLRPMRDWQAKLFQQWDVVTGRHQLVSEIERLRASSRERATEAGRAAATRVAELESLLRLVDGLPLDRLAARVLTVERSASARSALLDAGRMHGLERERAAVDAGGLVGRLVAIGERASRLLMVTDPRSRVPVTIGPGRIDAMLVGDGTSRPFVDFLGEAERPTAGNRATGEAMGSRVDTSGVGGVFPRGLPVGTLLGKGSDGLYRVRLAAELDRLDVVALLRLPAPEAVLGPPPLTRKAITGKSRRDLRSSGRRP